MMITCTVRDISISSEAEKDTQMYRHIILCSIQIANIVLVAEERGGLVTVECAIPISYLHVPQVLIIHESGEDEFRTALYSFTQA
jgi:hypothetical protein